MRFVALRGMQSLFVIGACPWNDAVGFATTEATTEAPRMRRQVPILRVNKPSPRRTFGRLRSDATVDYMGRTIDKSNV
jgi:hypothetical protein